MVRYFLCPKRPAQFVDQRGCLVRRRESECDDDAAGSGSSD